jgi:hypothetical protein
MNEKESELFESGYGPFQDYVNGRWQFRPVHARTGRCETCGSITYIKRYSEWTEEVCQNEDCGEWSKER